MLLDAIFSPQRFLAEIIWKRYGSHNDSKTYGAVHDVILFYAKAKRFTFNKQFEPYSPQYIEERFRFSDPDGRRWAEQNLSSPNPRPNLTYPFTARNGVTYPPPPNGWKYEPTRMRELDAAGRLHYPAKLDGKLTLKNYLDEMPGAPIQDVWTDLISIGGSSPERLGYPTQKPLSLMERIIRSSSNEGDVVLDPFCGCGTALHAAQKLRREWIGLDITHLAISLIEKRLNDAFPGIKYEVHGTPKDLDGARDLAARNKYQFQWWAVSLVNAVPFAGKKKGADSGIDGLIYFKPEGKTTEKAIVSVKGGDNVNVAMVRDLGHVVERERARIGVFITLADPTGPMKTEAVKAGFYETLYGKYPKLQIITIADLFAGKQPNIPLVDSASFKKATKEREGGEQDRLPF